MSDNVVDHVCKTFLLSDSVASHALKASAPHAVLGHVFKTIVLDGPHFRNGLNHERKHESMSTQEHIWKTPSWSLHFIQQNSSMHLRCHYAWSLEMIIMHDAYCVKTSI